MPKWRLSGFICKGKVSPDLNPSLLPKHKSSALPWVVDCIAQRPSWSCCCFPCLPWGSVSPLRPCPTVSLCIRAGHRLLRVGIRICALCCLHAFLPLAETPAGRTCSEIRGRLPREVGTARARGLGSNSLQPRLPLGAVQRPQGLPLGSDLTIL